MKGPVADLGTATPLVIIALVLLAFVWQVGRAVVRRLRERRESRRAEWLRQFEQMKARGTEQAYIAMIYAAFDTDYVKIIVKNTDLQICVGLSWPRRAWAWLWPGWAANRLQAVKDELPAGMVATLKLVAPPHDGFRIEPP